MRNFLFLFCFTTSFTFSQQSRIARLPKELKEISGLENYNDSLLFAINDGGNEPCVYLINLEGKVVKTITLDITNKDWEDIAVDETKEFLYIGDFGNNANTRKDLCIYKVNIAEMLSQTSVKSQKFSFHYSDQQAFPPKKEDMNYDCEAMTISNNRIYLFTKSNTKPYKGISQVYSLSTNGKDFRFEQNLELGNKNYFQNSVTAADFYHGKFYLSTYSFIYVYSFNKGVWKREEKIPYKRLTQKESLVVLNKHEIIVADEKSKLSIGQNLYKIELKK